MGGVGGGGIGGVGREGVEKKDEPARGNLALWGEKLGGVGSGFKLGSELGRLAGLGYVGVGRS